MQSIALGAFISSSSDEEQVRSQKAIVASRFSLRHARPSNSKFAASLMNVATFGSRGRVSASASTSSSRVNPPGLFRNCTTPMVPVVVLKRECQ